MSSLPPLRPTTKKQDVTQGSSDPRRSPTALLKLSLEQPNAAVNSCRAIHALWNEDVKEVTLRMYRVEHSMRASQDESTKQTEQHEEDVRKLKAIVFLLEEKFHMLEGEMRDQRRDYHDLKQKVYAEFRRIRELMHQITGDIEALKDNQDPGLSVTPNPSDDSDSPSSPATPEAMVDWNCEKPNVSSWL